MPLLPGLSTGDAEVLYTVDGKIMMIGFPIEFNPKSPGACWRAGGYGEVKLFEIHVTNGIIILAASILTIGTTVGNVYPAGLGATIWAGNAGRCF